MKLSRQVALAALLPVVFGLLIGGALWTSWRGVDRARRDAELSDRLRRAVVEQNILVQEYLLYGSPRAVRQIRQQHAVLLRLLDTAGYDKPDERAALARIRQGHEDMDHLLELLLKGQAGSREQIAGALLVKVQDLQHRARLLSRQQFDQVVVIQRRVDRQVLLALGILALLSGTVLVLMGHRLLTGLKQLEQGIKRVEGGDLDYRIAVTGADELVRLGEAFNAMTRRLSATTTSMDRLRAEMAQRERAEEEVRRLNASLEQRVQERTAELTAANKELDSFAYAVSHDLRAPLRAMNGFAQALAEDYGDRLEGEAKAYLDQIGTASKRMSDLVDGILTLSRCTRGGLEREVVDLSSMVNGLLEELARSDPARRVAVDVEPGLAVLGDPRMLEVVVSNLLENAWKYTGKAAEPAIRIYVELRDGQTWTCVADNGAGFDMAHAEHLFQPFQRLHRQDEFPGIGIGLATVQRIVHRHGGHIEGQGAPDQGAKFCFYLPGSASDPANERNES